VLHFQEGYDYNCLNYAARKRRFESMAREIKVSDI